MENDSFYFNCLVLTKFFSNIWTIYIVAKKEKKEEKSSWWDFVKSVTFCKDS